MKKKKVKFKSDPKAEKWAQRNYWFGKNKTLTYLAFDIHKDLIKLKVNPRSNLYYNLIDVIMNFVASRSVKLKKIYKNRNTVRLTAAQILIAKKLKVPLKQYARKI
jgi:hypothetical protein|tara:strand:- start:537 stop:854 length:318 start_codon:yes stop_codon:yes gene_type:complete